MIKNGFVRTLKSGLAALLLAGSGLNATELVNENHSDWLQAVSRTENIRRVEPRKIGKLEREIFNQSLDYKPRDVQTTSLPDYKNTKQEDIVGIFLTNAHYTTEVVLDLKSKLKYDWTSVEPAKRKEFIENRSRELESDPSFQKYIQQKYHDSNVDCKLFSSIATAMYLDMDKNAEVELVTGLFFDKKYAPTGTGHQWAKVGNQIIDPAIQVTTSPENYVPIMAVSIHEENGKYILKPKIYCLTPEMEKKVK